MTSDAGQEAGEELAKFGAVVVREKSRSLALLGMTPSFRDDVILTTNGRKDLLFQCSFVLLNLASS